jgi:hypothetical protein
MIIINNMKNKSTIFTGLILTLILLSGFNTASADSCTYVSEVTEWSTCSSGSQYAEEVTYASTEDPAECVDVPVTQSCTSPITYACESSDFFSVTDSDSQYCFSFEPEVGPSAAGAQCSAYSAEHASYLDGESANSILEIISKYNAVREGQSILSPENEVKKGLYIADNCSDLVAAFPANSNRTLYYDGNQGWSIDCSLEDLSHDGTSATSGGKLNDGNAMGGAVCEISAEEDTCYQPEDKFRITNDEHLYSEMDAACESDFGTGWEFATIDDADENEIMNARGDGSLVDVRSYMIKNVPSNGAPFVGQICSAELSPVSWPEAWKQVEIRYEYDDSVPFCYGDSVKTFEYNGLCVNTNLNSDLAPCDLEEAGGECKSNAGPFNLFPGSDDLVCDAGSAVEGTHTDTEWLYVCEGTETTSSQCSAPKTVPQFDVTITTAQTSIAPKTSDNQCLLEWDVQNAGAEGYTCRVISETGGSDSVGQSESADVSAGNTYRVECTDTLSAQTVVSDTSTKCIKNPTIKEQ